MLTRCIGALTEDGTKPVILYRHMDGEIASWQPEAKTSEVDLGGDPS